MNKALQFFALLICTTLGLQAQMADGSIAPDFTATDINGVEYNLYDLLDQGKSVVLDVSATWCGPCWSYHTGGVLEDVWEEHGPDGADDIFVIMIEGDAQTTQADLEGTGGNTTGDWITGTQYPIIDDASLAQLFQISYYPTLYHICPNRILTEIGQAPNVQAYVNQGEPCQVAAGANNGGIIAYEGFEGAVCGEVTIEPTFKIQNLGTSTMTTATVDLMINGSSAETIEWTGSLDPYQIGDVQFAALTVEAGEMSAELSNVNGSEDEDLSNNSFGVELSEAGLANTIVLNVSVTTDQYGDETYWAILDDAGEILVDGGNPNVGLDNFDTGQYPDPDPAAYGANETDEVEFIADGEGCYTFAIRDFYGDGMCCAYGDGGFTVTDSDGNVVASGGEFAGMVDVAFEIRTGDGPSAIEDLVIEDSFATSPNPVVDNVNVAFTLLTETVVSVDMIDITGKVVSTQSMGTLSNGQYNTSFETTEIPNGIFMVRLRAGNQSITQRVLKVAK